MKFADHLSKEQKQQLNKMAKRNKENLSRRDWEEIMGMNRDTYERKNGAWRRK